MWNYKQTPNNCLQPCGKLVENFLKIFSGVANNGRMALLDRLYENINGMLNLCVSHKSLYAIYL